MPHVWRCYSLPTLSTDTLHYVRGTQYYTRNWLLPGVLERCLAMQAPPYDIVWQRSGPAPEELRAIYLVHVPKTATTFMRTVLSYACGPKAYGFAHVGTGNPVRINGDCHGMRSPLQAGSSHGWMHMPVPHSLRSSLQHVVVHFRKPSQRLLSATHHIVRCAARPQGCSCCSEGGGIQPRGGSWGWSGEDRSRAISTAGSGGAAGVVKMLHRVHAATGCMTKMLLGIGCQQRYDLTPEKVQQAVGYVGQIGFVALMSGPHAYERSVCLLHARFGGSVYPFEVPCYSDEAREEYDESVLGDIADKDEDNAVYAAAVARFESEWDRLRDQTEGCMQAVRARTSQGANASCRAAGAALDLDHV